MSQLTLIDPEGMQAMADRNRAAILADEPFDWNLDLLDLEELERDLDAAPVPEFRPLAIVREPLEGGEG